MRLCACDPVRLTLRPCEGSVSSMERVAAVVREHRAQLWINHDIAQDATLRHSPQFYD